MQISFRKKKQVQFSVNSLQVHSMDLLSQYESSNHSVSNLILKQIICEDSLGEEKVLKENQPRTVYLTSNSYH